MSALNRTFLIRWLYVISLPVVLLNYALVAVGSLLVGNPPGASQLTVSLYFLLVFPLAAVTFVMLVAARASSPIERFDPRLSGGLLAVDATLLLALLTFVPDNIGTKLVSARPFSSVLSRVVGVPVDFSAHIANGLFLLFPCVLIYLLAVAIAALRRRKLPA